MISKELEAAKPFFEQHIDMLVERYCGEVPQGEPNKIVQVNLCKTKAGHKETSLTAYYEQLLKLSAPQLNEKGTEVIYHNFDFKKQTKHGTEPFAEFLESMDEDHLRGFGIY